ncbi:MAG: DUF4326 domain-containing protein [Aeromonas veronii]
MTQSNIRLPCRVVNRYHEGYDVYIGRGTKWGNPHKDMPRDQAISLYRKTLREYIRTGKITRADILELDGKRLGCSCKPKPCHGDIIALLVNRVCGYKLPNLDFLNV